MRMMSRWTEEWGPQTCLGGPGSIHQKALEYHLVKKCPRGLEGANGTARLHVGPLAPEVSIVSGLYAMHLCLGDPLALVGMGWRQKPVRRGPHARARSAHSDITQRQLHLSHLFAESRSDQTKLGSQSLPFLLGQSQGAGGWMCVRK